MNKAIFWDRDGVINEVVYRNGVHESPRSFSEFKLRPDIDEAIQKARELGFLNIVITNQPDIARGKLNKEALDKMHQFLKESLPIDDIFVCIHDNDDNCACRKPKPGLILEAARKWDIDVHKSFVVGDTGRDTDAAAAAGCPSILLDAPYNKEITSNFKVGSLDEIFNLVKV